MHHTHGPSLVSVEPLEKRTLLAATRIMPLGDSITEGLDSDATYRYWLWHQLRDAGHEVDFVGSHRGVFNGSPRFGNFDQDHQARTGYHADQVLARVEQWARAARPDIVLLHIGTNDLLHGQSVKSTVSEVNAIIDHLRAVNPDVTVLLAQVIPADMIDVREYNRQIGELAARKSSRASSVVAVDQYSGFDTHDDLYDGLHPDASGEKKLASRWMAALQRAMAPPDPNPFLSDLPLRVVSNGLGPVERNRSNGGAEAGDGRTIKLNNALYKRGLGVFAQSDIRFDLDGRFGKFTADAGVDDEVGNDAGSVIFRIFVDNRKMYDSGPVYGRTGTKRITLDVSGGRELRLLVIDKGDGNVSDSAAWANPRLFSVLPSGGGGGGSSSSSGGGSNNQGGGPTGGGGGGARTNHASNPFAKTHLIAPSLWSRLVEPDAS